MGRWTQRYVDFQKVYGLGEGQLGFIKNLMNLTGALNILNFVKLYFPQFSETALQVVPVAIAAYIVVGYIFGRSLDKYLQFVDKNRKWDNMRDPAIKELLDRVRRLDRAERV